MRERRRALRCGAARRAVAAAVKPIRGGGLAHRLRHGVVVVLLLAAKHLDVSTTHRPAVLLKREVHLRERKKGGKDVSARGGNRFFFGRSSLTERGWNPPKLCMSRRVALSSARSDDRGQGGQRSGAVATRTCMGLANRTYASPVVRPSRRTMRTSTGSRPWKNSRMSNSTALKGRPRRRTTGKTFSMAKPGPRGPAPKPGPIPPTMPGPKPIGFIIAVGSMSSVLKHARRGEGNEGGGSSARRDRGPRFSRSAKHVMC